MKKILFLLLSMTAFAQSPTRNTAGFTNLATGQNMHPSAILQLDATSKGALFPRMTAAQKNAISSPATGLMIYQTDGVTGFYTYTGTQWITIAPNAQRVFEAGSTVLIPEVGAGLDMKFPVIDLKTYASFNQLRMGSDGTGIFIGSDDNVSLSSGKSVNLTANDSVYINGGGPGGQIKLASAAYYQNGIYLGPDINRVARVKDITDGIAAAPAPTLQSVLNSGKTGTFDIGNAYAQILEGSAGNRQLDISTNNGLTGSSFYRGRLTVNNLNALLYNQYGTNFGQIGIQNGVPSLYYVEPGAGATYFKLDQSLTGNTTIHVPALPAGDYNVAMTNDITLQKATNGGDTTTAGITVGGMTTAGLITATSTNATTQIYGDGIEQRYTNGSTLYSSHGFVTPTTSSVGVQRYESSAPATGASLQADATGNAYLRFEYDSGGPKSAQIESDALTGDNLHFRLPNGTTGSTRTLATTDNISTAVSGLPSGMPTDFFISTTISSSLLNYKTDAFRTLDLQPLVSGVTIAVTSQIVRNGNDLIVVANSSIGYVTVITMKDCFIVSNVLTPTTVTWKTITADNSAGPSPAQNRIHGAVLSRGFLYLSNRPDDVAIPQRLWRVNPYNLNDVKLLEFPTTGNYIGQTTEIRAFRNYIYLVFARGASNPGYLVRVDENLNTYETVFTIPTVTGKRIQKDSPFVIYNDEIYICTFDKTTGGIHNDWLGIQVYSMTGTLKREIIPASVTSGTSAKPFPHWMTIYNGKLIVSSTINRFLARFDTATLALEESITLTQYITHRNSLFSDGYLYLNGETPDGTTGGCQLLKIKANNFTDLTTLISPYGSGSGLGSYGSIDPIPPMESLKTKVSEFSNDGNGTLPFLVANQTIGFTPTGDVTGATTGTTTLNPALTIATSAVTSTKVLDGTLLNIDINAAAAIDATKINTGVVSNTEFNNLDGTTGPIQTQFAGKITNGGDTTGATMTIGSNDSQQVAIKYGGTNVITVSSASTVQVPNGTVISNATSSRGTISIGTASAPPTVTRNSADAVAGLAVNNANASSTGNIAEFQGVGVVVAAVRKDGRAFGTDGTATNDFATVGQMANLSSYQCTANTTSTPFTNATLSSTYPNVPVGYRVMCKNIGTGAIYTKVEETGTTDLWFLSTVTVP